MDDIPDNSEPHFVVAALYKFARLDDREALQGELLALCDAHSVKGSLLLADEGVNGTIAGAHAGIDAVLARLRAIPGLDDMKHKESFAIEPPFRSMRVRLKREIVTMGVDSVDPSTAVGTYVKPAEWNALISDPDVFVIDARNDYEVRAGTFDGAVNPETKSFRQLPDWMEREIVASGKSKVAMFCTGGIRCEKASSYLRAKGMDEVYHLEGGILKYLEEVPEEQSLWQGECFVFDHRVTVTHGLALGSYKMCFACGEPVSPEEQKSQLFEQDISCPRCHHTLTDQKRHDLTQRKQHYDAWRKQRVGG